MGGTRCSVDTGSGALHTTPLPDLPSSPNDSAWASPFRLCPCAPCAATSFAAPPRCPSISTFRSRDGGIPDRGSTYALTLKRGRPAACGSRVRSIIEANTSPLPNPDLTRCRPARDSRSALPRHCPDRARALRHLNTLPSPRASRRLKAAWDRCGHPARRWRSPC